MSMEDGKDDSDFNWCQLNWEFTVVSNSSVELTLQARIPQNSQTQLILCSSRRIKCVRPFCGVGAIRVKV